MKVYGGIDVKRERSNRKNSKVGSGARGAWQQRLHRQRLRVQLKSDAARAEGKQTKDYQKKGNRSNWVPRPLHKGGDSKEQEEDLDAVEQDSNTTMRQLEKEMQDALDPTIGQTEIVAMKKEIHRMELRYDQLKKKQEEMIKDLERSVFKRETIQLKYLPKVEKKNV